MQALDGMLAELDARGTASMLPCNGERGYCAISGKSIIASAILKECGYIAYLWGMYVAPEHQRAGMGTALLKACFTSLNCARTIEVRVLESSPWAVSFYQHHGFVITGSEATELLGGSEAQTLVMSRPTQLPLAVQSAVCL